jgi:hypothetical protein
VGTLVVVLLLPLLSVKTGGCCLCPTAVAVATIVDAAATAATVVTLVIAAVTVAVAVIAITVKIAATVSSAAINRKQD